MAVALASSVLTWVSPFKPAPSEPGPLAITDGSAIDDEKSEDDRRQALVVAAQQLDDRPTLLPHNLALLITAASLAARVSIRASALFIEVVLESMRLSSLTGLGLTRRALISAVGSARALNYVQRKGVEWHDSPDKANEEFLNVLDKWTSAGVYFVHSTFSLVELFAMSGFALTSSLSSTGFAAAEESVRLIDGVFGSTETSRALASIVLMVRRELVGDDRFAKIGIVGTLASLTKALTAFACLQTITHRRTQQNMKMRVLYDCTIIIEQQTDDLEPKRDDLLLSDVRTALDQGRRWDDDVQPTSPRGARSRSSTINGSLSTHELHDIEAGTEITHELERLIGDGEDEAIEADIRDADDLPEELKRALDQLVNTRTVPNSMELVSAGDGVDLVRAKGTSRYFEIETTVTTETRTVVRAVERPSGTLPRSHTREDILQEDEWVEVSSVFREADRHRIDSQDGLDSLAATARFDTLESPERGKQRLQLALATMTKRLVQRKRTLRKITLGGNSSASSRASSPGPPDSGRRDVRSIEWPSTTPTATPTRRKKSGIVRALSSAKSTLSRAKSSDRLRAPPLPPPRLPTGQPDSSDTATEEFTMPRPRRPSNAASVTTTRTHVESMTTAVDDVEPRPSNFPHDHLARNLQRFVRYSSAAYGQTFMRLLGIGKAKFNYPSTSQHANVHAFAHHTGLPASAIVMSSFTEPAASLSSEGGVLCHYIAVDHEAKAVVLACRGTLGLQDLLTDLTAHYEPVEGLEHAHPHGSYYAHAGMLQSALLLRSERSTVHECLKRTLEEWPEYGLVMTGHSLAGGVVSLLAILLSCPADAFAARGMPHPPISTPFVTSHESGLPPGRPLHAYSFGPPCVASLDLSNYARGLVSSTVHNLDFIPTLSLGTLRDLKNVASSLWDEPKVAEEIVGTVVGLMQSKVKNKMNGTEEVPTSAQSMSKDELAAGRGTNLAARPGYRDPALVQVDQDDEMDRLWSLMKTLRAGNDKLYPTGTVYNISYESVFVQEASSSDPTALRREGRRVILRLVDDVSKRFSEPTFGRSMFTDHARASSLRGVVILTHAAPNYELAIDSLAQAIL